jgi:hypothetical protein
MDKKAPL